MPFGRSGGPDMPFVHLRTHSEYSVVDGTLRVDDAAAAAKADGQPALAITDPVQPVRRAVKFYKACRGKGVKPIIGADIFVEPEQAIPGSTPVASRLLLLVQNRQGYLNLCELLARGWVQNAQRAQAWITWGLAGRAGWRVDRPVRRRPGRGGPGPCWPATPSAPRAVAQRLSGLFPGRFYIELQRAGLPQHEPHVRAAVPLAAALGLPVVATHPIEFAEPDDFDAHEARVCVAEGETLANPKRVKRFSREQFFKTQAQMEALFADVPSAVANTLGIAQRCNLTLAMGKNYLPDFPTPLLSDGTPMPMGDYFRQASFEGLEQRLLQLFPDAARRDAERPRYVERLEFEITTILKMGFPGYFLIVADFINWAKNNGCPVGPGRGSGAGSLVAYALKITDLDPLHYKLLFERFLNPGTGVDARLRHRLLPGQPRPGHRLRQGQVRPRGGQPDRHLRHHGRQGCAARHRPGAGHGLRPCGQRGQADPGAAGQDGDPGQGAGEPRPRPDLCPQGGARAGAARGRRGRGGRAAEPGHPGGRHRAQHRHACRRAC